MQSPTLVPCASCARHVRASEPACPFCSAPLATSRPVVRVPTERLGRAALIAFGVGVASCSAPHCPPPRTDRGTRVTYTLPDGSVEQTMAVAIYGAPPPPDPRCPTR